MDKWFYVSSYKNPDSQIPLRHLFSQTDNKNIFLVIKEFDNSGELFTFKIWVGSEDPTQFWTTTDKYSDYDTASALLKKVIEFAGILF